MHLGVWGKPLLRVSTFVDAIDLTYSLSLPSRPVFSGIIFTDTVKEVNRGFHNVAVAERDSLEISNANAKEVQPRQLSLRSYGGLVYTMEPGYGCKRDR